MSLRGPAVITRQRHGSLPPGQNNVNSPVERQISEAGIATMKLFLPGRFTPGSAPASTDDRMRLVLIPAQRLVVMTFSGSRSQDAVSARVAELRAALEALDLNPERSACVLFYDPPWTLPWFRRIEVAIEAANDL